MWNGKPKKKTYADLLRAAQQHWAEVAKIRDEKWAMISQEITNSPDVKMRPDPSIQWSSEGVVCPEKGCKGDAFFITRWTTINGTKTRFEGKCVVCKTVHTYDWVTTSWIA